MAAPCRRSSFPTVAPPSSPRGSRSAPCCRPRRSRRASRASSSTSRSSRGPTSTAEPVLASEPDGLHVLRHSSRARARAGRLRPVARDEVRDRAADRGRLLLRPRAPGPISETDLPKIEDRMREIVAADQPFIREELSRAEALERFADQPYKREIVETLEEGEVAGGETVTVYRNDGWSDLCLGPHVPSDRPARRVQADEARGRVLARRRDAPDAHADLRHGVGDARTTSTPTCAASRRPRSATTGASAASSTCSRARTSSDRACGSGTRRAAILRKQLEDYVREAHLAGGYDLVVTPHIARSVLWETSGHLDKYAGQHVPADADGDGRLLREADELPVPRPGLQVADPLVPRPADAAVRARHVLPSRADRDAARPAADPRRDDGRRAHHLHARTSSSTRSCGCSSSRSRIHATFGFTEPVVELSTLPGRHDRDARDGRAGDRRAARRARAERPRVPGRRGGGVVLRPEGRLPLPRRDRAAVAAHDRAVRLRPTRTFRDGVRRRGQRSATAP